MVIKDHLEILKKGVSYWNQWRKENPTVTPDLTGEIFFSENELSNINLSGSDLRKTSFIDANLREANLAKANLMDANLSGANLWRANLDEANLIGGILIGTNFEKASLLRADLSEANLWQAKLSGANLSEANLRDANLRRAILRETNLSYANLTGAELSDAWLGLANLSGADLTKAKMVEVMLNGAILTDCRVYGVSAWGVEGLEEAEQSNLIITNWYEPVITVDNLEVAQFIYLMLHSQKIRTIVDTITSKVVLILGRFTPERKEILEAIRIELRKRNYLPVLFDFEKPANRDITETILTLAHISKFVIADITDAKSIPQELTVIVPNLPSVPVQPILLSTDKEYGMFEHFKRYPWVLRTYLYTDLDDLLKALPEKVIAPAELKSKELKECSHSD